MRIQQVAVGDPFACGFRGVIAATTPADAMLAAETGAAAIAAERAEQQRRIAAEARAAEQAQRAEEARLAAKPRPAPTRAAPLVRMTAAEIVAARDQLRRLDALARSVEHW